MVILITGASHVGKTLLAQKMLEKYKYPYLSIDHLKMGLIRCGYTDLTPEDDDELTDYLWPIVREIEWRRDIDQRYLEHIKFICLAMSEEYIEDHFDAIIVHESEVENRLIKADCTADDLKQCNRWFIDLFSSVGEKVVIIEDDFDKTLAKLLD